MQNSLSFHDKSEKFYFPQYLVMKSHKCKPLLTNKRF
jgi:hypothetical protein